MIFTSGTQDSAQYAAIRQLYNEHATHSSQSNVQYAIYNVMVWSRHRPCSSHSSLRGRSCDCQRARKECCYKGWLYQQSLLECPVSHPSCVSNNARKTMMPQTTLTQCNPCQTRFGAGNASKLGKDTIDAERRTHPENSWPQLLDATLTGMHNMCGAPN